MRLRFGWNAIRVDTLVTTRLADSRIYPLMGQAFETVYFHRHIDSTQRKLRRCS